MSVKNQYRHTAIGLAFVNALSAKPEHNLRGSIVRAADKGHGTVRERAWNAHLSFRTAEYLKGRGML